MEINCSLCCRNNTGKRYKEGAEQLSRGLEHKLCTHQKALLIAPKPSSTLQGGISCFHSMGASTMGIYTPHAVSLPTWFSSPGLEGKQNEQCICTRPKLSCPLPPKPFLLPPGSTTLSEAQHAGMEVRDQK